MRTCTVNHPLMPPSHAILSCHPVDFLQSRYAKLQAICLTILSSGRFQSDFIAKMVILYKLSDVL